MVYIALVVGFSLTLFCVYLEKTITCSIYSRDEWEFFSTMCSLLGHDTSEINTLYFFACIELLQGIMPMNKSHGREEKKKDLDSQVVMTLASKSLISSFESCLIENFVYISFIHSRFTCSLGHQSYCISCRTNWHLYVYQERNRNRKGGRRECAPVHVNMLKKICSCRTWSVSVSFAAQHLWRAL